MPDVGLVLKAEFNTLLLMLSLVPKLLFFIKLEAVEPLKVLVEGLGMNAVLIDVPGLAVVAMRSNSTSSFTKIYAKEARQKNKCRKRQKKILKIPNFNIKHHTSHKYFRLKS